MSCVFGAARALLDVWLAVGKRIVAQVAHRRCSLKEITLTGLGGLAKL